jgi:hypothetical protein
MKTLDGVDGTEGGQTWIKEQTLRKIHRDEKNMKRDREWKRHKTRQKAQRRTGNNY